MSFYRILSYLCLALSAIGFCIGYFDLDLGIQVDRIVVIPTAFGLFLLGMCFLQWSGFLTFVVDEEDDDDDDDDDDLEDRDLDFDDDDLDDTNVSVSNDDPSVYSPMPGTIIRMEVAVGDTVEAGQVVAIAEALKMEFEIKASRKGTVKEVLVAANDVVVAGQKIIHIE